MINCKFYEMIFVGAASGLGANVFIHMAVIADFRLCIPKRDA